jgi:2-desacetyl-2-hydroxyethyl bacteriochlorophyllide A dehydrogenase
MKAIVCTKYGLSGLELKEVETPVVKENEVLVKVHASSVNTHNLLLVTGKPFFVRFFTGGLLKPKLKIPGSDLAGRIVAVGKNVNQFKPGDEVYGDISVCGSGAFAEFVLVTENVLALKPSNINFGEAAAIPCAALVALQGLRDKGKIKAGHKVLVYGASGGIGTFAVQIAKYFGAEVTGVCSTENLEMLRTIGADHVVDYTKEDYTKNGKQYNLIFAIAFRSVFDQIRALAPGGIFVSTGGPSISRIFQEIGVGSLISKKGNIKVEAAWTVIPNQKDLIFIKELIETGKIKPVIDKYYSINRVQEALLHYATGHSKGKVIISIEKQ